MPLYYRLPEYVIPCWACKGEGEYKQTYNAGCGGGYYNSTGPCEHCMQEGRHSWKGCGYVYKWDDRYKNAGVPESVMIQIERMNPKVKEDA